MSDQENELTRREAIKLGVAATAAVSLGVGHAEAQARVGGFLTDSEFATLDELSEMIIPTDSQSPGARAAKVAAFIDSQLAEAWDEKDRTDWRAGLALVERLSNDTNGAPFMIDKCADWNAAGQFYEIANVIDVIMSRDEIVDLLHACISDRRHNSIEIPRARKAGVDDGGLAGRRDIQGCLPTLDVNHPNLERL